MSNSLIVKYTPAFSKDLKKKAVRRKWNLAELEKVLDLIAENSHKSKSILIQRHNMDKLSGKWKGSNECHVANAGDWLLVWAVQDKFAYIQRTGSHDEFFGK